MRMQDQHKVKQCLDSSEEKKNVTMKNAFDTKITNDAKKRGQFARFAKVKSEHFCGQGTDSQQEGKVEEDEWRESKTKF